MEIQINITNLCRFHHSEKYVEKHQKNIILRKIRWIFSARKHFDYFYITSKINMMIINIVETCDFLQFLMKLPESISIPKI
jgi:hypothetical protein